MMNVALITEIMSHYRIPVFNALSKHNVDLKVFYLREKVGERQWRVYREAVTHPYEVAESIHVRTGPARNFYVSPTIGHDLSRFAPKTIVCGGYNHTAALQSMLYARRHGIPLILWSESTSRDQRSERRIYEAYKRWFIRHCDRFLAAGRAAKAYLIHLGADPSEIWIAPDAVDNSWFRQQEDTRRAKSNSMNLLYVGRLDPGKGVSDLLQSVGYLKDRFTLRLKVIGDGSERRRLEAICRDQGLDNVHFVGFVQPRKIAFYYREADVFVFPSLSDPWGLVLNEAMASGLPIISSKAPGGVDDLVIEGYNGFTFDPGDIEQLTGVLKRFISLPEEVIQQMGARSQRIISYFTPERCAKGFLEAIHGASNDIWDDYLAFRRTVERG